MQGAWFRLLQQSAAAAWGNLETRGPCHSAIVHPIKTGLIVRTGKFEVEVTNNNKKKTALEVLYYWSNEANYWQIRSIARPLCDSTGCTATCLLYFFLRLYAKFFYAKTVEPILTCDTPTDAYSRSVEVCTFAKNLGPLVWLVIWLNSYWSAPSVPPPTKKLSKTW